MEAERRQHPRAKVSWPVKMEIAGAHMDWSTVQRKMRVKIKDISAGGAFVCCEELVSPDEELSIAIAYIPLMNRQLTVSARVIRPNIHCLDDESFSHGMGVRFTKLSDEDRELISFLISDYVESEGIKHKEEVKIAKEEQYSSQLALEIPRKGYVPVPNVIAASYNLSPGMRSPFTGYKVVPRKPGCELRRCSNCRTDLLVTEDDSACGFCGADYRARFSCANCHTTDDISYKKCNDCGLTICILCLAGTNGIPRALPLACPQCKSREFQVVGKAFSPPSS